MNKNYNIKFQENSSNGKQVVSRVQRGGEKDMTKLIVLYHSFANSPQNLSLDTKIESVLQ
jgi:hypothetical protein